MELPRHYNENRLILLVQEPTVIFGYWELTRGVWHSLGEGCTLFLRLYATGLNQVGAVLREVSLPPFTSDWYFRDVFPDHAYQIELGYYGPEGEFYPLLRSNQVITPRVRAVEGVARFLTVETATRGDTAQDAAAIPENYIFWGVYSSLDLMNKC